MKIKIKSVKIQARQVKNKTPVVVESNDRIYF